MISTTAEPLFALVERGAFLDVLYYRLNVVRVEVRLNKAGVARGRSEPLSNVERLHASVLAKYVVCDI